MTVQAPLRRSLGGWPVHQGVCPRRRVRGQDGMTDRAVLDHPVLRRHIAGRKMRKVMAAAEKDPQLRSRLDKILNVPHSENKLSWQLGVGG